jgi:hypothetical protein
MEAEQMRQDIVDRGIQKAENEMNPVLQPIKDHVASDPAAGRPGSNSGQLAREASDQTGTTPFHAAKGEDLPERAGISRQEQKIHEKQVDPKSVRESFKESELDTTSEPEPGEGKPAA